MNLPFEETRKLGEATRAIHCGEGVDSETKAIRRPIVMANSFELNDSAETLAESFDWNDPNAFNYPRSRHPNARYLEERLAGIEGGEDCVVGIHGFLVEHLTKRFGVELTLVDTTDPESVRAAIRPNTKLIHVETPSNPTTLCSDIAAIAGMAKSIGAIFTVDSTFSGMVMQNPIALGADLVMHSLTKYVNGHGDSLGGAVIGRKDLITQIRLAAGVHLGATISPFTAWLLMRSTTTLPMRMKRHCENALVLARFLEAHPAVKFVRYPGLESHPQHDIARKQMTGFGGMINFALTGGKEAYFPFLGALKIITHAVCLGHTESLVQYYPQQGNNPELGVLNYPEDIGEGFVRFSVGLEDVEDLIADLTQALG